MAELETTIVINPFEDIAKLKALASEPRLEMLALTREKTLNINEIAEELGLPQSTVATHISILEDAGLISTESVKAKKGNQKLCRPSFRDILIQFPDKQDLLQYPLAYKNLQDYRKNHIILFFQ